MSDYEQAASPPSEDFLRLMRATDRSIIGDLAVAACKATLDHQEIMAKTYWLINNGGLFNDAADANNPRQYTKYHERVKEIAGKLEVHGDTVQIFSIIKRYEDMTPVGRLRRGEA